MQQQQQQQKIDELKPGASNWWILCQPKYITCAAVLFAVTFVLSSVLVTEQTNMVLF